MYLQENEVTPKKISDIFSGAFMDVSDIQENTFLVKGTDSPYTIRISVDDERKIIRFVDFTGLHRISEQEAALICNEINKSITFTRFYATKVQELVIYACEYDMTYEKGVIPYHVMANFRLFEKIVSHAIHNYFTNYLKP